MNDLIAKCVLEEAKLKKEKTESALLISHSKVTPGQGHGNRNNHKKPSANTHHKHQGNKGHGKSHGQTHNPLGPNATIKKAIKCFFCRKEGHIKKDCYKYKSWLEKKKKQEGGN